MQYPAGKKDREYIIPNVTKISSSAFRGCINLTRVVFPESITKIQHWTFFRCKNLTDVIIPAAVTKIEYQAFYECEKLTNILLSPDNPAHCVVDGVLFNKELSILKLFPGGLEREDYVVPNSVSDIENGALSEYKGSVTLPEHITKIDRFDFSECNGFKKVTIPASVTEIAYCAFWRCKNLEAVNIHATKDSISIDESAFPEHTTINFING